MLLVVGQSFRRRHPLGRRLVLVDILEGLQVGAAFLREILDHLHELPPGVGQAMGDDRVQNSSLVGGQGVADLDWLGQTGNPLLE